MNPLEVPLTLKILHTLDSRRPAVYFRVYVGVLGACIILQTMLAKAMCSRGQESLASRLITGYTAC